MVDFRRLRASKTHAVAIDPVEIFRRMPKPPGINDLYTSQEEVLKNWFSRRNEHDTVIKLHTGGGKTLVGLLIAQSIMNEFRAPVIYLSPTVQLVQQIIEKARSYDIPATAYDKDTSGFPDSFYAGKSVLVCTYQALFNGRSRFGVRGSSKIPIEAAGIILDDAHVAFSTVRESFTLRIDKKNDPDDYNFLATLFREDFEELNRIGTFNDIVTDQISSNDDGILEVPYWSWKKKIG